MTKSIGINDKSEPKDKVDKNEKKEELKKLKL